MLFNLVKKIRLHFEHCIQSWRPYQKNIGKLKSIDTTKLINEQSLAMFNAFKMQIDNARCKIFGDWLEAIYVLFIFCVVGPSTVNSVQSFIMSGI